ncbi:MAG: hypothetical protein JWQ89_1863 [Devosia sp.]|uniref:DUF3828 domain-containing protein n=1 Tax=Devosia sp. TaxID=1871048 RepID=UPI002622DF06|nr:DUF3828 domain-containing protein [Devosia sp.]MDB5540136.1 hypothetical protein [Devosia sp.]
MRLLIALAALVMLGQPAIAQAYADPKALLEALYAGYMPPNEVPPNETPLQSARLNNLFAKDAAEANGEIGRIDFGPYINGQDYQISKLVISAPYYAGGKAVVRVTFDNFDTPQELGFLLVDEDGWKIDDVWGGSAKYSYDLLDILEAPLP